MILEANGLFLMRKTIGKWCTIVPQFPSPKYYRYHPVGTDILPSYNRVMRSNIGKV